MEDNLINNLSDLFIEKANEMGANFQLEYYDVLFDRFIEVHGILNTPDGDKCVNALFDTESNKLHSIPIGEYDRLFRVAYANDTDLIVEFYSERDKDCVLDSIAHFKYNSKNKILTKIRTFENYGLSDDFYEIYGNGENALLSVDVLNKKNQKKRQLYSLKNGFFVSPKVDSFSLLRKEDDTLVFSFKDVVSSNDTIDGEALSTDIYGAINSNGQMYDKVYIDYFNREKNCALNDHDNFMQYSSLKNHIARNLDMEVERLIDDKRRKTAGLRNYMAKIKTLN